MKSITRIWAAAMVMTSLGGTVFVAGAQTAFPPEKMQGAIAYVSGGIGLDEANALKLAAARYPLELEFARKATPQNEYVSDVGVVIKNQAGKSMLKATSDGPYFLAKLPEGKYTVSAERHGDMQQRVVQIRAHQHARLIFVWQK
ncbi:hypothetical protein PanNE5_37210 [Pandoraea sp. NE5]|uniref:carboxypeptidase-like regulatory domain-containing protein n=1 Tax=Pandoraea sp. NE5 TaxID=2904129 RepID=UPI0021C494C2|nr:carboxypeptidase-like regulatory domain-containing protein [Pandoraea sp. NE5]BDD94281.1 hypothetical protein PanNE5_37210 [Pandoraea sp. NE5]